MELARREDKTIIRINMSSTISPEDLLGKETLIMNESGYREIGFELQPFVLAYQNGWWVVLDELNLAPEKVLQLIADALDNKKLSLHDWSSVEEPVKTICQHPDFQLFATQNPSSGSFRGHREQLSGSFLSRFTFITFKELPSHELVHIVMEKLTLGLNEARDRSDALNVRETAHDMVQFHNSVMLLLKDSKFPERGGYASITVRELLRWSKIINMSFENWENTSEGMFQTGWLVYGARFRQDGGPMIANKLNEAGWQESVVTDKDKTGLSVLLQELKLHKGIATTKDFIDWTILGAEEECPISKKVCACCEKAHAQIGDLLMDADFIEKYGLYIDFSVAWLWDWMKMALGLLHYGIEEMDKVGSLGAQLYSSRLRHQAAREHVYSIFASVFGSVDTVFKCLDSVVPTPPLYISEHCIRYVQLALLAVQNGDPVLLVGKSGCGKSSIAKAIGFLLQRHIEYAVMTPDSEPATLLGQQMPCPDDKGAIAEISWVDGPLTRAYRNGSIHLIENIGQAPATVLERFNSPLENPPVLCLAEKGDKDPLACRATDEGKFIKGPHKDYLLIATFTPYGKSTNGCDTLSKEMSPALANRFSTIYVADPCESEALFKEELAGISRVLLPYEEDGGDVSAASVCWSIHNILFPVRSQLAPLTLRSYTQFLDSAYLILKRYEGKLSLCNALRFAYNITFRVRIKNVELCSKIDTAVYKLLGDLDSTISPMNEVEELKTPADLILTESRKVHAAAILTCDKANKPVLLEGEPAAGKTALLIGLCKAIRAGGSEILVLNNSDTTTLQDYYGAYLPANGRFVFFNGMLIQAMVEGLWFVADEFNLAPLAVISELVNVLDGGRTFTIPGTSVTIDIHQNFRFFATQNGHQTAGRKLLPVNIRSRFLEVQVEGFPKGELNIIIERRFNTLPSGASMTPEVCLLAAVVCNLIFAVITKNNLDVYYYSGCAEAGGPLLCFEDHRSAVYNARDDQDCPKACKVHRKHD